MPPKNSNNSFDDDNDDFILDNYREDDEDGVTLELSSDARRRRPGERRPIDRKPPDRQIIDRQGEERRRPSPREEYQNRLRESREYDERRPRRRPPGDRSQEDRYYDDSYASGDGRRYDNRRRSEKPKSKLVYFYILTLLAGVIVCVVLFAIFFKTMVENNPIVTPTPRESAAPIVTQNRDIRQASGMITAIDIQTEPHTLSLLEIANGRTNTYGLVDSTHIRNRFGTNLTPSEIRVGMIVDIGFDVINNDLATVSESTQAWELGFQNNVRFNLENSTISIGNDTYSFNNQTIVHYNGDSYPISQVSTMDTITLVGTGTNVWFIRLEGSHGYIRFEQYDKIVNGFLQINNSIFMPLSDFDEPIPLVEGTHRVMVEGQNIETFISDVVIRPSETLTVNLIDIELRLGRLLVTVSEPDATVIINGEAIEPGAVEVEYGDHLVRVEKEGFLPVEEQVTVSQPLREVIIELSRVVKTATVVIYTAPSPAEIFIDNVFVGYSPLTREMETGPITVTARLEGHIDATLHAWEIIDGENARTLMLFPSNADPFSGLPPPDNLQPVEPDYMPDIIPENTPEPFVTDPWNEYTGS